MQGAGRLHGLSDRITKCSCVNSGDDLLYRTSETMTAINTPNINFKWDPKSLEIRTLAVERLLEPLVTQVGISDAVFVCSQVKILLFLK